MKESIRQRALELGFDDCRFTTAAPPQSGPLLEEWLAGSNHGQMAYLQRNAPKRKDPSLILPGAKSIITLAVSYAHQQEPTEARPHTGLVARYARYQDYHDILGERLKALTQHISLVAPAETRSLWYVDTGPVLERDIAQRSGLGFVGKHTNLISRKLGNWIFLAEILTTLEFPPDQSEHNHCGRCVRCITACPTQAIRAPFQLDARLCISYLTIELKGSIPLELRPLIGNRIYGCDDCLQVCPWNRFARAGAMMSEYLREDLAQPDLLELLSLNEDEFRRQFAGTPMLRTKRRGLLRNVCVALGNIGDEGALPALERATLDPEPLIAEHAWWAIERITERLREYSASRP